MSNNIDLYVQEIEDSKQQIKQAIMIKGVTPTGGLSSFPEAILQIENNKEPELAELIQSIENNGLYEFYPEEGKDGFSSAHIAVDVPIPTFTTQTKSINVTQNGDYSIEPDSGYDGLSSVEVSVKVPTSSGDKQIIPNGFYFGEGSDIGLVDFSQYDWSLVYDTSQFFKQCKNTVGWDNFEQHFNGRVMSGYEMFYSCTNLTSVPQMDTSKVTNMKYMFQNCTNLKSVPQMDTSNVINMKYMFQNCSDLTSVPQMDTSNVMNMSHTFDQCSSITSVPQMDTSNVTNMEYIFYYCSNLTTVGQLDISKVTNMNCMFQNCKKLIEVRFKGQPTSSVNVTNLFGGVKTTGTLYYDSRYDYSRIIGSKPSTWTAVPYDVEEYESQL